MTTVSSSIEAMPRVALFIEDLTISAELEKILRDYYSSLLLITEREKLVEFTFPCIIILDVVTEVYELKKMDLPEGSQILVITRVHDTELRGAVFEIGATDCLDYPFVAETVIAKVERYLEAFRRC